MSATGVLERLERRLIDATMKDTALLIRPGRSDDAAAFNAMYDHYVSNSVAVFDEEPMGLEARIEWMARYADEGPHRFLVAERDGRFLGFASSQPYRTHVAFRECVETSIMLVPDIRGRGVGSRLYEALFGLLATERLHRAYAGIALPNPASCALHEKFGFRRVGVFDEYALKNGARISSAWYEKKLDSGENA